MFSRTFQVKTKLFEELQVKASIPIHSKTRDKRLRLAIVSERPCWEKRKQHRSIILVFDCYTLRETFAYAQISLHLLYY